MRLVSCKMETESLVSSSPDKAREATPRFTAPVPAKSALSNAEVDVAVYF